MIDFQKKFIHEVAKSIKIKEQVLKILLLTFIIAITKYLKEYTLRIILAYSFRGIVRELEKCDNRCRR